MKATRKNSIVYVEKTTKKKRLAQELEGYKEAWATAVQELLACQTRIEQMEKAEPIAWLNEDNRTMRHGTASVCFKFYPQFGYTIPLYLHPQGEKDPTPEEIISNLKKLQGEKE